MVPPDLSFPSPNLQPLPHIPGKQTGLQMLWSTFAGQPFFGVSLTQQDRFIYANDRFAELLDYPTEEVIAMPSAMQVVYEDDRDLAREVRKALLEREQSRIRLALRAARRDGAPVPLEVQCCRVMHNGRPAVFAVQCDVSERARHERRRVARAKRSFARRVAHDLSNVLASIDLSAQFLARDERLQESHDLSELRLSVARGVDLCRRLVRGPSRSRNVTGQA